jgi:ribosomal subunit interface protein
MRQALHVRFQGMEESPALRAAAEERALKLEQFCADLTSCRVCIELDHKHSQQGRPFVVRIDLTFPGHELSVSHVQNEDAYVALRDAFDNMRRQLEDRIGRLRGQQKARAETGE